MHADMLTLVACMIQGSGLIAPLGFNANLTKGPKLRTLINPRTTGVIFYDVPQQYTAVIAFVEIAVIVSVKHQSSTPPTHRFRILTV